MQRILAAGILVLLIGTVAVRILLLRGQGIRALKFGDLDKRDFLIPPFGLFYLYSLLAAAFDWPFTISSEFFRSATMGWVGVLFCMGGWLLVLLSTITLGRSFRVGIDLDRPGGLVTGGVFRLTRNPIYVGIWIVLLGQFLVFPSWIPLIYLAAATWLIHRQVLREEGALRDLYGQAFVEYCRRVRRYL